MQARKNIQEDALEALTDRVARSVGILKHAYMISTEEFIKLFCEVRLGISKGLVQGITYEQLGTLLVEAMPATLTLSSESTPKGEAARDKLRAARIKAVLDVS
jgi:protein arginine kinase